MVLKHIEQDGCKTGFKRFLLRVVLLGIFMTVRGGVMYVRHVVNCAVELLQIENGLKWGGEGAEF